MKLSAKDIEKYYSRKKVVKGISLEINSGEIVGLLGPNGAGKTTTFNILVGFISPNDGDVYLDKEKITDKPMYERARMGIGYLAQEATVFRNLSVEDNLRIILERTIKDEKLINQKIDNLLNEFSISRLRKQKAYSLSGGEKRRLEVARVMVNNPKIILLDEPFVGIDPITVGDLKKIIKYLKSKDVGVLLSDHNVRETLSITDRSYLIYSGEILIEGSSDALLNDSRARELYLGWDFKL